MKQTNPIIKALQYSTRKNAIAAMCAHCMGCTEEYLEMGFRLLISACSSKGCPLYPFRPYRAEKSLEGRKTAIQSCFESKSENTERGFRDFERETAGQPTKIASRKLTTNQKAINHERLYTAI